MGRPLKKQLFGNTNFGLASTSTDDGLGGGGITSITQLTKGSPNLTGTLTVSLPAPTEPGGVQATATATVTGGDVTFVITNPGSGYRSAAVNNAPTVTSTSGQTVGVGGGGLGYVFLSVITGGVAHIRITANILGLSNNKADIVKQLGTRLFLVKNANGTAIARIHPAGIHYAGNCPAGFMFFYAHDNNSARYVVSKISAHKLILVQDPTSSGWLFASGSSVKWRRAQSELDGARTNADVTLDTILN